MWQVVLGRTLSGAGSAGMTVLVSILITGTTPKHTSPANYPLLTPSDKISFPFET